MIAYYTVLAIFIMFSIALIVYFSLRCKQPIAFRRAGLENFVEFVYRILYIFVPYMILIYLGEIEVFEQEAVSVFGIIFGIVSVVYVFDIMCIAFKYRNCLVIKVEYQYQSLPKCVYVSGSNIYVPKIEYDKVVVELNEGYKISRINTKKQRNKINSYIISFVVGIIMIFIPLFCDIVVGLL